MSLLGGDPDMAVGQLFGILPLVRDPELLENALLAYAPRWGGDGDKAMEMCDRMAPSVAKHYDYTPNTCKVNITYKHHYPAKYRRFAQTILANAPEEFYHDARIINALHYQKDYELALRLYEHRGTSRRRGV